ncbi:MAG: LamG-like jellyroll fold domain-containing protein [Verrucomicrobiales bacterium]
MKSRRIRLFPAVAAAIAVASTASASIVSQWSFENGLSDTAAAGATADNLVDNAGGVTYVPGIVGQAVAIRDIVSGSNRLTATTSADLNLGNSWTLELFVWPDSGNDPAAEWERVWTKWGEGGNEYHTAIRGNATAIVPDGIDMFVNGGNNIINHNSTATVARLTWSHIAFVGDQGANTITAWLNGTQVASVPFVAIAATAGNMNFGNFGTGDQSGLQFSGYIDEALIHDSAVDQNYLLGRAALIPEPSVAGLMALVGLLVTRVRRR